MFTTTKIVCLSQTLDLEFRKFKIITQRNIISKGYMRTKTFINNISKGTNQLREVVERVLDLCLN